MRYVTLMNLHTYIQNYTHLGRVAIGTPTYMNTSIFRRRVEGRERVRESESEREKERERELDDGRERESERERYIV